MCFCLQKEFCQDPRTLCQACAGSIASSFTHSQQSSKKFCKECFTLINVLAEQISLQSSVESALDSGLRAVLSVVLTRVYQMLLAFVLHKICLGSGQTIVSASSKNI